MKLRILLPFHKYFLPPHVSTRPVVDNPPLGPPRHGSSGPFLSGGHVAHESPIIQFAAAAISVPVALNPLYIYIYIYVVGLCPWRDACVVNNVAASSFISYMLMNNLVTYSVPR